MVKANERQIRTTATGAHGEGNNK